MAFGMGVKLFALAMDLDHCHVTLDTSPSGSVTLAVIATPTRGCRCDRATAPSSSIVGDCDLYVPGSSEADRIGGLQRYFVYVVLVRVPGILVVGLGREHKDAVFECRNRLCQHPPTQGWELRILILRVVRRRSWPVFNRTAISPGFASVFSANDTAALSRHVRGFFHVGYHDGHRDDITVRFG